MTVDKNIDTSALVIITRPDSSGEKLTAEYKAAGYDALHLSVMQYESLGMADSIVYEKLAGASALAFTSGNGVRALMEYFGRPSGVDLIKKYGTIKKIFAVGPMTSLAIEELLQQRLFAPPPNQELLIAGGNVEKLAQLITEQVHDHEKGAILHIGAAQTAGEGQGEDLVARLLTNNIAAEKLSLYNMVASEGMDDRIKQTIKNHPGKKIILFFSPRTVVLTAALLRRHGFAPSDFFAHGHTPTVSAVADQHGFQ